MTQVHEGGCLCGAVRYRITGEPKSVGYCHCRMCQRAAGAPVVAWATVPADALPRHPAHGPDTPPDI